MRAGLQKLGRWTAGRLQGSKGVQKYDKYMEKSPFARGLLTVGDLALAATGGAMLAGSGAGAGVKGLLMGSKAAAPNIGGTAMLSPGVAGQTLASVAPAASSAASTVAKGGKIAGLLKGARENKDLLTMAGKGIMSTMPQPGEDAAMMNAETTRMRFEEEQRQMRMEEERRRRVAELLMPYAQSVYGSLGSRMNG